MADPTVTMIENELRVMRRSGDQAPTLRALAHQMTQAAQDFAYAVGTGPGGELLPLGAWRWSVDKPLPDLPPLPRGASQRQQRDQRIAESLQTQPEALLEMLRICREIVAESVQAEVGLRNDGYSGKALGSALVTRGEALLERFKGAIGRAALVAERVSKVRRDLAAEGFETDDADRYLRSLSLEPGESENAAARDSSVAVQTAVYDVAIVNKLAPLSAAERTLVLEARDLPPMLKDPRVLAALFRAPRPLLPYDDDELRGIASLAFLRNWPRTSLVTRALDQMIEAVRPAAGTALLQVGRMLDATQPYGAFARVPGGLWALEPLAETHGHPAQQVVDDLRAYGRPLS